MAANKILQPHGVCRTSTFTDWGWSPGKWTSLLEVTQLESRVDLVFWLKLFFLTSPHFALDKWYGAKSWEDLSTKSCGVMLIGEAPTSRTWGLGCLERELGAATESEQSTGKTDFVWITSSSPWGKGWGEWKLCLYLGSVVGAIGRSVSFPKSTF